jgi:minor extracellular serine protease Vpr
MKPEIVAPGAYISTTQNDTGYNVASGTSYAAPHVSGAIALLLQKNPELNHNEIKSLLLTTVEPVSDAYGKEFSIHDAGSGRLDIENAFNAKLIVMPPNFIVNVSSDNVIAEKQFELKLIDGVLDNLDVEFKGPEFIKFSYFIENGFLKIKMTMIKENFGDHEGKIIINHDNIKYTIPFLLHYTPGSISVNQENSKLSFDIYHPEEWSFAKISIINSKDGKIHTITTTPNKTAITEIYENTEYWIDAKIRVNGNTSNAFNIIEITSLEKNIEKPDFVIPERQIIIIAGIITLVGIVGFLKR